MKVALSIYIILSALFLITLTSASLGDLIIKPTGQEWQITKQTGNEANFDLIFINQTDKGKVDICFVLKPGINPLSVDLSTKSLYDRNGNQILDDKSKKLTLKYETSKCDGGTKDGYHLSLSDAKSVNIDDYIKLGNESVVIEYQNQSKLEYQLDWSNSNITLYKNISGVWNNTVDEIFVFGNNNTFKFGANDSANEYPNESLSVYKYTIESSHEIYENGLTPYIARNVFGNGYRIIEKHYFDFGDICTKVFNASLNESADCEFTFYKESDLSYLDVVFKSDSNIDPTISISEFTTTTSVDTNITQENNFTHLTIDTSNSPYNNLIAYYSFDINHSDKGNVTYDYSNYNHDGTANNVIWQSTCMYGGCAQFDGSANAKIDLGTQIVNTSQSLTYSAWILQYAQPNLDSIIQTSSDDSRFGVAGDGRVRYRTNSDNTDTSPGDISLNTWYNVVVTFNTTTRKIYINGVEETSEDAGGSESTAFNHNIGAGEWNGLLDEIMVFNTSLSATQVADIYNNKSARFYGTGTQELKQFNITVGNNTINITTNNFQEFEGSNLDVRVGEWDLGRGYNDTYNGSGYTLNDGLIGYWHFDNVSGVGENDTLAIDWSGNGNNGTFLNGMGLNTSCIFEKCITSDDINDVINIGNGSSLNLSGKNATVVAWVNKYTTEEGDIISRLTGNAYIFQYHANGLRVYDGSFYTANSLDLPVDGTWHFIAMVVRGTGNNITFYLDERTEQVNQTGNGFGDSTSNVLISARTTGGATGWNGSIDELLFYNRSLSDSEIKKLYVKGKLNYNYLPYQNVSSVGNDNNFSISTSTTNIVTDYKFDAGNLTDEFYTPILQSGIDFDIYNFTAIAGDTTNPNVTINQPLNQTYSTTTINFNVTAVDETEMSDVIYSLNGGVNNFTMANLSTSPTQWTAQNTSMTQGSHTVTYYANDTSDNLNNTESVTFFIDSISPVVSIVTPANNIITSNQSITINISITDAGDLDELIYNWNGTNYTLFNDSLVLFMNFDNVSGLGEGNTNNISVDLSGTGNNGTIYNMSVTGGNYVAGKYGNALSFDGVNDYVSITDDDSLSFTTGGGDDLPMTISAWVYMKDDDGFRIVNKYGGAGSQEYQFDTGGADKLQFYLIDSGTDSIGTVSNSEFATEASLNEWHHVVATYNGSENESGIELYIDGAGIASTDTVSGSYGGMSNIAQEVRIGRFDTSYTNGSIDEVMVFNRALSQAEVYQLYVSSLSRINEANWTLYVNQSLNAIDTLPDSSYTYQTFVEDFNNNANSTEERTITIETLNPTIDYQSETPANGTIQPNTTILVNVSVVEANEDSIIFNLYYSNNTLINSSLFTDGTRFINFANLNDANYLINVTVNDTSNNINSTVTRFITLQTPVVSQTGPDIARQTILDAEGNVVWAVEFDSSIDLPLAQQTSFKIGDEVNKGLTIVTSPGESSKDEIRILNEGKTYLNITVDCIDSSLRVCNYVYFSERDSGNVGIPLEINFEPNTSGRKSYIHTELPKDFKKGSYQFEVSLDDGLNNTIIIPVTLRVINPIIQKILDVLLGKFNINILTKLSDNLPTIPLPNALIIFFPLLILFPTFIYFYGNTTFKFSMISLIIILLTGGIFTLMYFY